MKIEELTKKFYLGTLTKEENDFLTDYLKHEDPQQELSDYYQDIWDKSKNETSDLNSQELYNRIISAIGIADRRINPAAVNFEKFTLFAHKFKSTMRYAAVFIFAFGLSWLVHLLSSKGPTPPPLPVTEQIQTTVEVPYGSKSRIILPDGSVVTLNSGSKLKYSYSDFSTDRRMVYLTGEGFFNVTKNSSKPFYVITPGIKVKVLGTTFNVKAYTDEDIEETTLVTGKVEIYSNCDKSENEKPVVLKPNQKAVFSKTQKDFSTTDTASAVLTSIPVELKTINLQPSSKTEQTISWKENTLIFDNEPFSSLIVRMERWYNVKIQVNYTGLNSARFTGKFDKETLEQVLSALVTVTPFNYTIKHDIITISEK